MGFDFTIAIVPGKANIDRELQYVKSALLYADSVTLISPMAYFFTEYIANFHTMNLRQTFDFVDKLVKLVDMSTQYNMEEYTLLLGQLRPILTNKGKYHAIPMKGRVELQGLLRGICEKVDQGLINLMGVPQSKELRKLQESGRLRVSEFNRVPIDAEGIISDYFRMMTSAVENSYPLFDEQSNNLMGAAVKSNIIKLSDVDKRKITHAGFSDNIVQRLPSFDQAPVDEILDIRKELNPSISRFRSKMISYSDTLQTMPWDKDFESECSMLYYQEVAPAITEIDELSRDNSFLKNLGGKLIMDKDFMTTAGQLAISVAAGGVIQKFAETGSTDPALITAGGVWAAQKLKSAYDEYTEKKTEIRRKDLYFYYQAGKKLSKQ